MDFWTDLFTAISAFLKFARDSLMGLFTGWGMSETAAQLLMYFLGILLLIALIKLLEYRFTVVERRDHLPPEWMDGMGGGGA